MFEVGHETQFFQNDQKDTLHTLYSWAVSKAAMLLKIELRS